MAYRYLIDSTKIPTDIINIICSYTLQSKGDYKCDMNDCICELSEVQINFMRYHYFVDDLDPYIITKVLYKLYTICNEKSVYINYWSDDDDDDDDDDE